MNAPERLRVQYIVDDFPQLSQTYLRTELASIRRDHDVAVIALKPADRAYRNAAPHVHETDEDRIVERVQAFRPHVLHTHYLHTAELVERVARRTGVPFTVRTHSFDVIPLHLDPAGATKRRRAGLDATRSSFCLGVLAFPFLRPALERVGIPPATLVDAWPVIDHAAFVDRGPRGRDVMNVGACIPKKRMEDFADLARVMPDRHFRLYAIGYRSDEVDAYVRRTGSPVEMVDALDPSAMPAEFRRHGWLVYTGCFKQRTVGWPLAIAEAQASGLGVVVARVRPDLATYVGPAGFLYDRIDEVPAILARGYPDEMREAGYEHARRSDIEQHRHLLTDRWRAAAAAGPRAPEPAPAARPAPVRRGLLGRWVGRR
jgi:glycosyltransferase involved in cell wall biosynthesis